MYDFLSIFVSHNIILLFFIVTFLNFFLFFLSASTFPNAFYFVVFSFLCHFNSIDLTPPNFLIHFTYPFVLSLSSIYPVFLIYPFTSMIPSISVSSTSKSLPFFIFFPSVPFLPLSCAFPFSFLLSFFIPFPSIPFHFPAFSFLSGTSPWCAPLLSDSSLSSPPLRDLHAICR